MKLQTLSHNNLLKLDIFLIIFLTSSFVVCNNILSSAGTIFLWIFLAFNVFFVNRSLIFSKSLCISFVIILTTLWISYLVNGDNLLVALKVTFSYIAVFVFANTFKFDEFKQEYIKVMKFLCLFSLVCFFLYIIVSDLKNLFVVYSAAGQPYSCLWLYVDSLSYTRNCGLFWEPGAFQSFIILALIFEMFNENIETANLVIFTVSIITTFSTTGYLGLCLILLIFMNKSNVSSNKKMVATILVCIIIMYIYFNQDLFFSTSSSTVFGKVINFFNQNGYENNTKVTSSSVRFNSIVKPFEAFFTSPIVGLGRTKLSKLTYKYTHNMNTCTMVNWFAYYGIFYGGILSYGYYKFIKNLSGEFLMNITLIFTFFVLTMSENYVDNAFFILIALYGIDGRKNISVGELQINYENYRNQQQ